MNRILAFMLQISCQRKKGNSYGSLNGSADITMQISKYKLAEFSETDLKRASTNENVYATAVHNSNTQVYRLVCMPVAARRLFLLLASHGNPLVPTQSLYLSYYSPTFYSFSDYPAPVKYVEHESLQKHSLR